MNPRQRRGVLLLALAVVGAIGVFVLVANYVTEVRTHVGPMTEVLYVRTPVGAFEPVGPDAVEQVSLPERWAPEGVLRDPLELLGVVATGDLEPGTLLQPGMLVAEPSLETGQREIATLVDAETGVAGKVGPGAVVDIYAAFAGVEGQPPQAEIVVQQASVIDVGVAQDNPAADEFRPDRVVPVTFALSIEDSLRLSYADSFAQKVSLALRAPGDAETVPPERLRYRAPVPDPPASP